MGQINNTAFDPHRARVLLIKPHWLWGASREACPPMGLMYLSSALKKRFPGIQTRLLDLRLADDKNQCLADTIRDFQPDVSGFLCLTGDQNLLEGLFDTIKQTRPETHICCGGPYPSHCPEDFQTMRKVDSIVRGEGEQSFCDLVDCLSRGIRPDTKKPAGFSLRRPNGYLAVPDLSAPIMDLDSLPFPDWDILDIDLYSRMIQINVILAGKRYMPVFTSRGCPFHCMYCHNIFGKKVRMRSPENVVDEIECLVRHYNIDEIQFYDDIFNIDRDRVIRICDLIIERGLSIKISFPNAIRGDMADDALLLKLKQAGAYMITFAMETASPRLQKLIRKNLDIAKTINAIRFADSLGLITRGFFMVGFPTETEDEIKKTVRMPSKLPLTTFSMFSVVPFKGTSLYDLAMTHANDRGRDRLKRLDPTFFASATFYSDATGINLRKYIYTGYFLFFTPIRLVRYFLKIPRKGLYVRQLLGILTIGFMAGRKSSHSGKA